MWKSFLDKRKKGISCIETALSSILIMLVISFMINSMKFMNSYERAINAVDYICNIHEAQGGFFSETDDWNSDELLNSTQATIKIKNILNNNDSDQEDSDQECPITLKVKYKYPKYNVNSSTGTYYIKNGYINRGPYNSKTSSQLVDGNSSNYVSSYSTDYYRGLNPLIIDFEISIKNDMLVPFGLGSSTKEKSIRRVVLPTTHYKGLTDEDDIVHRIHHDTDIVL